MSESIFTIHEYKIDVPELNKPIYIRPFGDVHRFAHACNVDAWLEYLEESKVKNDTYFLGMGDYDDMCSWSERKALTHADLHDETMQTIEDIYTSRVNRLVKEIEFMKGRIIGLVEGNHYGAFKTGMTTTQEMCRQLDCKYLGAVAFIRLVFKHLNKTCSLDMFVAHGKGAARLLGGSLNRVQQLSEIAEADIYLMGHDHQKVDGDRERLRLQGGNGNLSLVARKILFARTGSFLRGYMPNKPSYIVKALLPPSNIGAMEVVLIPTRKRRGGEDRFFMDIHSYK